MTVTDRLGGARSSLAFKAPCKVATTANITLSGEQTIDGVAVVADDRVLVKDQTNGAENGIYEVRARTWVRAADWGQSRDFTQGTRVNVVQGTVGAKDYELTTSGTIVLGTTSLTFAAFDPNASYYGVTTTNGTASRSLADRFEDVVNVLDFGAAGDGVTDDTASIQAAIDHAATLGFGARLGAAVYLPPGGYSLTDALVLKTGVILKGSSHTGTSLIKASQSATHWMIESENFSTLSGSNNWYTSDGVPTAFGVESLSLWGQGNPPVTASDRGGIRLYGKRFFLRDVMVHNVDGVGVYTECANAGGQLSWTDLPEGEINNLWVYRAGDEGFVCRGPHDNFIGAVYISTCGGDAGAVFQKDGSTYNGTGELLHIHSYANTKAGVILDCPMHVYQCIGESNGEEGVIINDPNTKIDWLQAYSNNNTGGSEQVLINSGATNLIIDKVQMTGSESTTANGITNNAAGCHISAMQIDMVSSSTGTGLENNASRCYFAGKIDGSGTAGSKGLVAAGAAYSKYILDITTFDTLIETTGDNSNSTFDITYFATSVSNVWSGSATALAAEGVQANVRGKINTTQGSYSVQLGVIEGDNDLLLENVAGIARNTSDGSDNALVAIGGGGSAIDNPRSRGGFIEVHGNEHATFAGQVHIEPGNVTGSKTVLYSPGTTSQIEITADGIFMVSLPSTDPGNTGQLWNNSGTLAVST